MWAEIPFVDLVGGNGSYENPNTDREAFFEITKQQLTELIEQNRNHPAIFCWGLQNEVKAQFDDVMIPFTNELHALAKRLDPTRYTTQATNQKTAYHWKSDLIAWNIYPGWYGMNRGSSVPFWIKCAAIGPWAFRNTARAATICSMRNGRKNLYITAAFTPKNTKPSAMNHFFGKSTGGTTFGLLLYGICLTSARMDAMKEIAPA